MKMATGILFAAILIGCAKTTPSENAAAINEFRDIRMKGTHAEFISTAQGLIKRGEPAWHYASLLSTADRTKTNGPDRIYYFWWKGVEPRDEPDTYVAIRVDQKTPIIKSVEGNIVGH